MERMGKIRIKKGDGTDSNTPVAGAVTAYSQGVKINHAKSFCLSIRAQVSSGTPDVDLYVEQTHVDDPAQGAIGDGTSGWTQIEGAAKILDITDTNWHHLTVSPAVLPWIRLKAIGQGTNPASCELEAYLHEMEQIY